MKSCRLCGKMFFSSGRTYLCNSCRSEVLAIKLTLKQIQNNNKNAEVIALKGCAPEYWRLENNYRKRLGLSKCKDIDNCLNCTKPDCILPE